MPIPLHGQAVTNGLSAPVALSASQVNCAAFTIKAPLTNVGAVWIGSSGVSSTNGYQLDPGDEHSYERIAQAGQPTYEERPSDFYVVGTFPDKVTWLASP